MIPEEIRITTKEGIESEIVLKKSKEKNKGRDKERNKDRGRRKKKGRGRGKRISKNVLLKKRKNHRQKAKVTHLLPPAHLKAISPHHDKCLFIIKFLVLS